MAHIMLFNNNSKHPKQVLFDARDASKKNINIYLKEREMIRKIAATTVLLMCIWILLGCHTVHGVGQDIESGGRAIERSSGQKSES